ncbi:MAG: type II CAAX endopeptidase family protein [Terriglobales bacterium]
MSAFREDPSLIQPSPPDDSCGAGAPARESGQHPLAAVSSTYIHSEIGPTEQGIFAPPPIEVPRDPAWTALDLVRLVVLTIVALIAGVFAVVVIARFWIYPHSNIGDIARIPLVAVAGQGLAYLLVFGYMYILVTRERGRPDFLNAIHWNWPSSPAGYVLIGVVLSFALQILASRLPIPKNLPIDTFFSTPAEAWVLTIFGITLAPLMEELFFRGFLFPVLARGIGVTAAIFVTGFAFALLHGSQLMYSWGPVLVIFLVGIVLTMVRARKNSVAAGLIVHIAYNGTISALMFYATDGFRHLEKLNGP